MPSLSIARLVRYFIYITIINAFAAVAFTAPIIIPELAFPLKLEVWPGTWMFIAYLVFLIVGVLGTLGWAVLLDLIKRTFGIEYCDKFFALTSIVLIEVAVYTLSILMFTAGYIGGSYAYVGQVGSALITYIIGPLVIPMGVSIFIYCVGTLLGLMNVVLAVSEQRNPSSTAMTAPQASVSVPARMWPSALHRRHDEVHILAGRPGFARTLKKP